MNWINLTSLAQLEEINQKSTQKTQIIYKHSTTCTLCIRVKEDLDAENVGDEVDIYYLDLLNHRDISNEIANLYSVRHESPQILIIKNGKCTYHSDHTRINIGDIIANI